MSPMGHPQRWRVLGVMCVSLVLAVMSVSGLNVALPTLVRQLGASAQQLQWIVDAYALVFAALLLTAGALGDRFGRKRALLAGFAVFGLGAAAAAGGTAPSHLVVTRAVMGAGAALIMPATLSIIVSVFADGERSRAIAVWAGVAGLGGTLGTITSGALLRWLSWQWLFLVLLPVVVAAGWATARVVPESLDPRQSALDLWGAGLSLVAMGALVFAIIEAPSRGLTDPLVAGAGNLALVAGALFVQRQRTAASPMVPVGLVRQRNVASGLAVVGAVFAAMFALFFLLTQYLQFVRGWSTLQAGLANLPIAVGLMVAAPASDRAAARLGRTRTVRSGLLAMAAGFAVLVTLGVDTSYWLLAAGMLSLGSGAGLAMAPSTTAVMDALPEARAGIGSGLNDTAREVGAALGVAVMGALTNATYRSAVAGLEPLPDGHAQSLVESSVGGGLAVAAGTGGAAGSAIAEAAATGFTNGVARSFAAAAALSLVAAGLLRRGFAFRAPSTPSAAAHVAATGRRSAT